ncbi:Mediator of RNA polymerase II transcription subunit 19 [Erysiphe necator]|nr:Mediator of RNA polymerase II transcription subunit 19 [Erysiphe necator]
MPYDHPQTPESPRNSTIVEIAKQLPSPSSYTILTPAHSINGSVSSNSVEMSQYDATNKRKRENEDDGNQKCKRAHIEAGRLSLEDLHLDVGKKYKICHTPTPTNTIDLTQDLFALFRLENVSKSVARTNPDGSKGVRLRKTYKNHIKDHQLSGNFDSIKREIDDQNSIFSMMMKPQEDWDNEYTGLENIEHGITDPVKQLMNKAFKMARGPIPKPSWNSSVLGDLAPSTTSVEQYRHTQSTQKLQQQPDIGNLRTSKLVGPRPRRSVKKRTYGDSSFEGYGEGYVDDEDQEVDFAISDGDGISRKRPRKSSQTHGFQSAPTRHNSYGPGMVGA